MNAVQQVREALLARAAELHIEAPSEEAMIDALLDREVAVVAPSEAECLAHYEAQCAARPDAYRPGSIVELDHILFAVTDPLPHPALRARAEALLQQLLDDDTCFGESARSVSNCPSAEVGGNLGQLTQGDVVPEFWQAVMAHGTAGLVPQLVQSRFGLHIVRIQRVAPGPRLPFELARRQIEEQLAEQRLRAALHDYVHGLVHPGHDHEHPQAHDRLDHASDRTEPRLPSHEPTQVFGQALRRPH
jgi:peptidyl-prolyl cis-trans isomerase C